MTFSEKLPPREEGNNDEMLELFQALKNEIEALKTKFYLTEAKLQLAETEMREAFIGSVAAFAMEMPPEGWLVCDGQAVSREQYARLFQKIGITFGKGNGHSTFNIPDLKGYFVRGWDTKGTQDPNRLFGSTQDDQMQSHRHNGKENIDVLCKGSNRSIALKGRRTLSNPTLHLENLVLSNPTDSNSGAGKPRHGNETIPKNVALLYCIKY